VTSCTYPCPFRQAVDGNADLTLNLFLSKGSHPNGRRIPNLGI
jgi:hypothetical protein